MESKKEKPENKEEENKEEKSKEEPEGKLEKISKLEYEELLLTMIQRSKKQFGRLTEIYGQYLWDKENYYLKYFKRKNNILYTKHKKRRIGYNG